MAGGNSEKKAPYDFIHYVGPFLGIGLGIVLIGGVVGGVIGFVVGSLLGGAAHAFISQDRD